MIDILFHPRSDSEHKACRKDVGWRINNLYSVVDKAGTKRKFRQNAVQRRAFLDTHGLDVYLKSRRHGITTEKCIETFDRPV